MSGYHFYGAESAEIQDSRGLNPKDYYDILSKIWCAETCAPRLRSVYGTVEQLSDFSRQGEGCACGRGL